jgi:formate dehydrogenase maturation protein FdhE
MNLKCEKCGWEGHPNLEETGPHTKATCGECGAYIKMLSKRDVDKVIDATINISIKAKKHPVMSRAEALDTYIEIRDSIKDLPTTSVVYNENKTHIIKEGILNLLSSFAESHSTALSKIEELENEKNDPLFGEKATQQRIDQMALNFTYMSSRMDALHSILCPHLNGTWQERANQVVKEVQAIKKLLERGVHD